MRILFITEKWCDGNPAMGLTNNYHNLFSSLANSEVDAEFNIVHMDEYAMLKNDHVDNLIPRVCDNYKPDVAIFSFLGTSPLNPTMKSIDYIKKMAIKIIMIWPDVSETCGIPQIREFKDHADLHVCWGSENNVPDDIQAQVMWLWAPQDEKLYYPTETINQDIAVSFLGSLRYKERQDYAKFLSENRKDVLINGGQRENRLDAHDYADIMRRSKISLNFPWSPFGFDQCKGRVWEILASRSLLFERKNIATERHLKSGYHYVQYTCREDLLEKINFYLDNDEERLRISTNGYEEYKKNFSSTVFWNTVLGSL
tara:strand:- start:1537 stop:2475 length:939 start_codon:yes stop_codon:yes gene_type:complete